MTMERNADIAKAVDAEARKRSGSCSWLPVRGAIVIPPVLARARRLRPTEIDFHLKRDNAVPNFFCCDADRGISLRLPDLGCDRHH
jgi:hypothetical protein